MPHPQLRQLPESVIVETTEYKCLQSQFSVLYNDSMQLKTQLEETRHQLQTSKNAHLRQIEQMEVSERRSIQDFRVHLILSLLHIQFCLTRYNFYQKQIIPPLVSSYLIEWRVNHTEETQSRGDPAGGHASPGTQGVRDAEDRVWAEPSSQRADRAHQPRDAPPHHLPAEPHHPAEGGDSSLQEEIQGGSQWWKQGRL